MSKVSETYRKYKDGGSMTNGEVIKAAKFFRDLRDQLVHAGPTFYLAFKEANEMSMRFEEIGIARNILLP